MLNDTQQRILRVLNEKDQTLAAIARLSGYAKPTLVLQLQKLEQAGWIERRQESAKKIYFRRIGRGLFEDKLQRLGTETLAAVFAPVIQDAKKKPVLVCGYQTYFTPEQLAYVQDQFQFTQYPERENQLTAELFLLRYKHAEIALVSYSAEFLNESLLKQCKRLRHVVYLGKFASTYISKDMVEKLGIKFWDLSSPDMNFIRNSSTEFALASLLSLLRPTQQAEQEIGLTGSVTPSSGFNYRGEELWGKTVGIIGVDNSARTVGPILRSFGAKLRYANPDKTRYEPADYGIEHFDSVADLFRTCDIVIYTDNYYRVTPRLEDHFSPTMRARYLLVLGEYNYTPEFMRRCREHILGRSLNGLHLDYWSFKRFEETADERLKMVSEIMYFPNVRITPFLGPSNKQVIMRRNQYAMDILQSIQELEQNV